MAAPNPQRKKLLIVTYYWPPSGGAGVLRWLKLSKCLSEMGVEVHVLTVDPKKASYPVRDERLVEEIPKGVTVHTTRSFEPVSMYARLVGKDKVPTAGFGNVDNSSLPQRAVNWLRGNLFHPDPRVGWKRFAVVRGLELIDRLGISTVFTTSPPHSVQLIGRTLKRKRPAIRWIADLRDPWTDIYYYDLMNKSALAKRIDRKMEKSVLLEADHILTISEGFRTVFLLKIGHSYHHKFSIVPNGYAVADFSAPPPPKDEAFTITYTGTIAESYDPYSFLDTVGQLQQDFPDRRILPKFVGILDLSLQAYLKEKGIDFEHQPPVSHAEIVNIQRAAHVLLLVSPAMKDGDFIIPGKAFEYLAAGPPILGLAKTASETENLLNKTQRGQCFTRQDTAGMYRFIQELLQSDDQQRWRGNDTVAEYSRTAQAREILSLIAPD